MDTLYHFVFTHHKTCKNINYYLCNIIVLGKLLFGNTYFKIGNIEH